jgi:hypothetical protein
LPYLDDVADAYAAADLMLTRAGASTLGELAALDREPRSASVVAKKRTLTASLPAAAFG